jgi:hypothetical protein
MWLFSLLALMHFSKGLRNLKVLFSSDLYIYLLILVGLT